MISDKNEQLRWTLITVYIVPTIIIRLCDWFRIGHTYWRMGKSCVTYLLTFFLSFYYSKNAQEHTVVPWRWRSCLEFDLSNYPNYRLHIHTEQIPPTQRRVCKCRTTNSSHVYRVPRTSRRPRGLRVPSMPVSYEARHADEPWYRAKRQSRLLCTKFWYML